MDTYDFEQAWLGKFSDCLEGAAGKEVREEVMVGADGLTSDSSREEVIAWTQGAMARLGAQVGTAEGQNVMAGCACQHPKAGLLGARETYAQTRDPDAVLEVLQMQFESFLRDGLGLKEAHMEEVVSKGWGLAGIREGNRIVATKIPKSGYLVDYLEETDLEKKRQYYCHCPRIRDALRMGETLPAIYCYCGAGFYKGIWEEILQRPVEVEVLESVLDGGDVCKIAISLPPEATPEVR